LAPAAGLATARALASVARPKKALLRVTGVEAVRVAIFLGRFAPVASGGTCLYAACEAMEVDEAA